jgi:hypothetical protein
MVVQPHPVGGRDTRWHCMPSGAGLLPADVSPFSGDIIFNSLVAYPMGAGRIRIAPGKQAGKDGGKPKLKNVLAIWLPPRHRWSFSSTVFQWVTPRLAMPKTGRAMPSLASAEVMREMTHLSGTLVFSALLLLFPCKWKMWFDERGDLHTELLWRDISSRSCSLT